jgi:hypothetical protein
MSVTTCSTSAPPPRQNQNNSEESRGRTRSCTEGKDRYSVSSPSPGKVETCTTNVSLRSRTRSRSCSVDEKSSEDERSRSSPLRRRSSSPRNRGFTHGTSFDTTLRTNPTSPEQAAPQLEISLKKTGSSSDTTIKSYHMVEWNGKRYRLTQTHFDGTQNRYLGFTEDEWESIAKAEIEIWNKAQESNSHFDFSNYTHNVDTGVLKYREAPGLPVQTIDLMNSASTASQAPYANILPTIRKAQEVQRKVKPHAMKFVRNPPRPTLPSRKKPEKPPAPPANPLNSPLPPPEEIPWYRLDKRIANWFKKPSPPDSN